MEKSTKVIIGIIAGLFALLIGVTLLAKNISFEGYKDENGWIHNADSSTLYETDVNASSTYAIVSIDKEQLTNIDAHEYIETVSPILNGYSEKHYTTILLGDGTGIYYPGSNIDSVALYGNVNNTGVIIQELGQIKVNGTMVTYTESAPIQSAETKDMYQYLPEKYKTDNGSVVVIDGCLYISIGLQSYASVEEATIAAEEVFLAFSGAGLSQYENVEIVINNEFIYRIINNELVFVER